MEKLLQLKISSEINEHGKACFSGVVSRENSQETFARDKSIVIRHGKERVLFAGQVIAYQIKTEGSIHYIEAECRSSSIDFDKKKNSRSFQDTEMTFGGLLQELGGSRKIILADGSKEKIPYPFIQYGETDWEFLKRIAGHLHMGLVPDILQPKPQVFVGFPQGRTYSADTVEEWEMDFVHPLILMKIAGKLEMQLCDNVVYGGNTFLVVKKEVCFSRGLLECNCWIGKKNSKAIRKQFNRHLCGMRLGGTVESVEGEKLKIKLDIDWDNERQHLYEYPYLPITGNGMYAMPEIGSVANLYFPESDEKSAFVIDCLYAKGSQMGNPEDRRMKTMEDKFMGMFASGLKAETEEKELIMSDKYGINLCSGKQLQITAEGNISIKANGITRITAKESIHMEEHNSEGENYLHMEGLECTVKAKRIKTSDAARKPGQLRKGEVKENWKAMDLAGRIMPKILGAVPVSVAEGVGGKLLGGIPDYGYDVNKFDLSEAAGVYREGMD